MSISTEISRIQTAKSSLTTAISEKGVTVSSDAKLEDYADLVSLIDGGGITPTGTIQIAENGTVDVTNYASAEVNVSGGGSGIGEYTKHQRVVVTPSDVTYLSINHTLGVVPKLVVVTSEQTFVSTTFMVSGVWAVGCGGSGVSFASGGGFVTNAYTVAANTTGSSNAYAYFNSDNVVIRRATSARQFDTGTSYTVDLYA